MKNLDYNGALKLMTKLSKKKNSDIAVFTDRGWGDDHSVERTYEIIEGGDGQKPLGSISKGTFDKLREVGVLGENTLMSFKARTLHDFKGK